MTSICGKALQMAFNVLTPPKLLAGKNLTTLMSKSNACIISVGVATPGM